jgi:hypothetical protein
VSHNKQRYATDPEYRERKLAAKRQWHADNSIAVNARRRAKYAANPEIELDRYLRATYGLSLEDYNKMSARQNHACASCSRKPREKLHVDHSHRNRKLRSLLCRKCNVGFGHFDDDPARLRAGADYLEIWQIIHARQGTSVKRIPKKTFKKVSKSKKQPRTARRQRGQPLDARGNPARAALLAGSQRQSSDRHAAAAGAQPRAKGRAGRRRGDQGRARRIDGKTLPGAPDADDGPTRVNLSWGKPK